MAQQQTARAQRVFLCATVVLMTITHPSSIAGNQRTPQCSAVGPVAHVPELPEGSGVAASRRTPGRIWAHNDSGQPVLVALNERGAVTGHLRLTGVGVEDWEAMAVGPCPAGSCLYIGDVGDNSANRKRITLYRVPEPHDGSVSVPVGDVFHATYPDGPHDAEAILITPKGEIFVVTKGDTGPVSVYQFPRDMRSGTTVELSRVGQPRDSGKAKAGDRVTDGAVSPNGAWIALRTNRELLLYASSELVAGNWREAARIALNDLGEPQGEGVAFATDTTLYLVGEGGGKSRPGTFGRVACTF